MPNQREHSGDQPEREVKELLGAAVRLNTRMLASIFGLLGGLSLMGMTYLSLYRGLPKPGQYLNLLGVFLPGYEVSPTGAWFGLCWGAAIGALCAIVVYRIYARQMFAQIDHFAGLNPDPSGRIRAVLTLDGPALGTALGALAAGSLILSTNWLVLRGTATESVHALLLAHYLPGYSVSLQGSVIGALELFAIVFLASWLLSAIYNRIATRRARKTA